MYRSFRKLESVGGSPNAMVYSNLKSIIRDYRLILKGNVGVMMLSWIIFSIGWSLVMPYLSIYIKLLGGGDFEVSLVRSLGMLASAVMVIPGGYLTDILGRRRIIIPMTWTISVITFLYAIVPDWTTLLILWVIDSALHFYRPALMTIIVDSLPSNLRARGIALALIAPHISWLIMPPIGGLLYDTYGVNGIRLGFIVAGLVGIVAATLRTKFLRETYSEYTSSGIGLRILLRGVVYAYSNILRVVRGVHRGIKVLALDLLVLNAWGIGLIEAYGVIYATECLNVSGGEWGIYISIATLTSIILGFTITPVLDSIPRKKLLVAGLTLKTIPYILLLMFRVKEVMIPTLILSFISTQIILPSARNSYVGDRVPAGIRGRVLSFMSIMMELGYVWSILVIGYIYSIQAYGPYTAITLTLMVSLIEILYVMLFLKE